MPPITLARLMPLTGAAFFVLILVALIIEGSPPAADDATEEVVRWWTDNDSRSLAAAQLGGLASALLVWFGGSMRATLRRAEGEPKRGGTPRVEPERAPGRRADRGLWADSRICPAKAARSRHLITQRAAARSRDAWAGLSSTGTYLESSWGCPRRSRRGVRAASWTRYLECVHDVHDAAHTHRGRHRHRPRSLGEQSLANAVCPRARAAPTSSLAALATCCALADPAATLLRERPRSRAQHGARRALACRATRLARPATGGCVADMSTTQTSKSPARRRHGLEIT